MTARLEQLERMWTVVRNANQPAVLPDAASRRTLRHRDADVPTEATEAWRRTSPRMSCTSCSFRAARSMTPSARRSSRTSNETYQFLINIPWTGDLGSLAMFASSHHEKLDGSGYPRRLKGDEIPVQVRMMTIADIFDALTESDRPYKKAVPADKALDIIRAEARRGSSRSGSRGDHDREPGVSKNTGRGLATPVIANNQTGSPLSRLKPFVQSTPQSPRGTLPGAKSKASP